MPKLTVVVIGASRGLGFGFVKKYLEQGYHVIATHRNNGQWQGLKKLQEQHPDKLNLETLEITDGEAVNQFAKRLSGNIDILIFNAGIWLCPKGAMPMDETTDQIRKTMEVNTYAPDNIMRVLFSRLLHANACVVYMSSTMASLADNAKGRYGSYRASKIAGNILFQNWDIELAKAWVSKGNSADKRPCAFPISPGVVQTDMAGDSKAPLTVEESVNGMVKVIDSMRDTKRSGFYLYDGSLIQSFPQSEYSLTQTSSFEKTPSDLQGSLFA